MGIKVSKFIKKKINKSELKKIFKISNIIEERQKILAKENGYEIIDHSMVLYVKPIKD